MTLKEASAGTLESGDIFVRISPSEKSGLEIDLQSPVMAQFGAQIKTVIEETLAQRGIDNAKVSAVDKGALDCTIRARVAAAAVRAGGKEIWE